MTAYAAVANANATDAGANAVDDNANADADSAHAAAITLDNDMVKDLDEISATKFSNKQMLPLLFSLPSPSPPHPSPSVLLYWLWVSEPKQSL